MRQHRRRSQVEFEFDELSLFQFKLGLLKQNDSARPTNFILQAVSNLSKDLKKCEEKTWPFTNKIPIFPDVSIVPF